MAKTLAELQADVRQIIGQPSASVSSISDAQLTIWLNDAYRRAVTELQSFPVTNTDYAPTSLSVSLNAGHITIDRARFSAAPQNEFEELEIIGYDEFIRRYPDYEGDDTGIPQIFVRTAVRTGIIYPAPNSANSGRTLRVSGMSNPTSLSASTDVPTALVDNLHDILPNYAAFRAYQYLAETDKSTQQLILFNQGLKAQRGISQGYSRGKKHWWFAEVDS